MNPTCPNGHEAQPGDRFCRLDGQPVALRCPNGHEVTADMRFCRTCGTSLVAAGNADDHDAPADVPGLVSTGETSRLQPRAEHLGAAATEPIPGDPTTVPTAAGAEPPGQSASPLLSTSGAGDALSPPSHANPTSTWRRRNVLIAGAVIVLALVAGSLAYAFASSGSTHNASDASATSIPAPTPAVSPTVQPSTVPPTAPATTTPPTTTSPLPLFSIPSAGSSTGGYSGRYPTTIYFSTDSTNVVSGISWSSWEPQHAVGNGTWTYLSCVPDCASGSQTPYPATITLSDPVNGLYTTLTEVTSGPYGSTSVYTYGTSMWPQGAQ